MSKIAWVIPGGGARSVYTAGAVAAADKSNLAKPDIIVCASGGAGSAFYYTASQAQEMYHVWCELLTTRKFCSLFRFWKLANIDYLVDNVFKKQDPLNIEKIRNSKIIIYVAVNDSNTGELKYFTNKDDINLWQLLKATKSAWLFTGFKRGHTINHRKYCDSRISSRFEMNLLKAIELGADKIYVFGNYHPKSSIINGKLVFKSWLLIKNKIFKKNQMRYLNIMENIKIPDNVEIFHFKPDKRLLITPWRNNRKDLIKTYMRGYNETLEKIAQLQ